MRNYDLKNRSRERKNFLTILNFELLLENSGSTKSAYTSAENLDKEDEKHQQ